MLLDDDELAHGPVPQSVVVVMVVVVLAAVFERPAGGGGAAGQEKGRKETWVVQRNSSLRNKLVLCDDLGLRSPVAVLAGGVKLAAILLHCTCWTSRSSRLVLD